MKSGQQEDAKPFASGLESVASDPSTGLQPSMLAPDDVLRAAQELGKRPERCLLCGGGGQSALFERDGKVFWSCGSCQLIYVHDIYPEFTVRSSESRMPDVGLIESPPSRCKKFDGWLKALEPHKKLGRMLEVGCGQGEFMVRARKLGWQVQGLDVDAVRVRLAREERGLDVFQGQLEDSGFEPASYDVVVMNQVIEHVVEPIAFMQGVRKMLRPGGVAFLRTGNARSWSARLRKAAWEYYRFGYHAHIRFYSPRAAEELCRAAGFASVDVSTRGFALRESSELRGKWFKQPVKLLQGLLSILCQPLVQGHRMRMTFHQGTE